MKLEKIIRRFCAFLLLLTIIFVFVNVLPAVASGQQSIQTWAVIVCGGDLNEPYPDYGPRPVDCFQNQIAETYTTLLGRGYGADHIFYLDLLYRDVTGDGHDDVDALSTKNNVNDAITSWLSGHSDSNDVCLMYFVDHGPGDAPGGNPGYVWLKDDDYVYDYELAQWVSGVSCGSLIIVIEACYSGAFIDDLGGANRIVVTCTDAETTARCEMLITDKGLEFSPYPAFSHPFFQGLADMESIGKAFNDTFTESIIISAGGQFPLLDDNGDGVGHGPIPDGGDGDFGFVECWVPGDCDGDDVINIIDIAIVCNAFGSEPGDPKWDPRADINCDGVVNILDLAIVNLNYGYGK